MRLDALDERQRAAVLHGDEPLLVVAGAGTGKTTTLAHRVAHLIERGIRPERILLLTFARRAAQEMLRRADGLLRREPGERAASGRVWGGTFHAVALRLLRLHGEQIGLPAGFTVQDRADSEDLLDLLRAELDLAGGERRFPRKATCLDVYSRCVNSQVPLPDLLERAFPWCREHAEGLKTLFRAYTGRKAEHNVLDYDDLLCFADGLLADPAAGASVRERFDAVLVDEYQDTNALQASLLERLRPGGRGLTVVGDDAQAIYSFRAATVRHILDFPARYPSARTVVLTQSFRSTPPLLAATNRVIAQARERHAKELWSARPGGERPELVTCRDEEEQTELVVKRVLERREQGIDLRRQAVLFRASHHSAQLEIELGRRGIPFHKYGGLRFLEAAHVRDLLAFLRLVENPRDLLAGMRVLSLLPGIGPKSARALHAPVATAGHFGPWRSARPPSAAREPWRELVSLCLDLSGPAAPALPAQVERVRGFYAPLCEARYDHSEARLSDLDRLAQAAAAFSDRAAMLAELTLDPPQSTQELAGPPSLDDDYLVLSTIHSAKGLEFDAVYLIHAADGNIPSDLAAGSAEELDEELRLLYVALSRARDHLSVLFPLRWYDRPAGAGGKHSYAQLTRFLPPPVRAAFDEATGAPTGAAAGAAASPNPAASASVRKRLGDLFA
ncbi:MAG TPA: ATP-dependent helicase [Anaeromyxobacteraceae bacterium]|nr:ATP-dependent helicase [Anaeromyxobacteraceae bacterium]